jgi:hypothetical protein
MCFVSHTYVIDIVENETSIMTHEHTSSTYEYEHRTLFHHHDQIRNGNFHLLFMQVIQERCESMKILSKWCNTNQYRHEYSLSQNLTRSIIYGRSHLRTSARLVNMFALCDNYTKRMSSQLSEMSPLILIVSWWEFLWLSSRLNWWFHSFVESAFLKGQKNVSLGGRGFEG